ncbi:N-acetylneuraminate synthase family protein [Magnetospirillum gryphiswaldense]|uniref:NeuB n=1 Tax=Magnetospirillum gryphiswaldense TaxID=55518 RepID=A4U173_9PROT|nr:N-acetylneuraminate synthase family protein [Magnetospirillum gryphiswaldense]AVM75589.1 N,N'-diacetyllegionaminic acid synthase [Magnetospirillum gryphiswaldense MSR-1]AVM79492.1 N,N'-diacetyllegionaminic acid synthase [Magnetospirillum gryphiswaldense]CAM76630.1 NeuB [Magnetospirillum gryphiswaldense MSR-1]
MSFLSQFRKTPLVIAEIGAKYADMPVLKEMVRSAVACGVDMVKFQTFQARTIATPGSYFTFDDGSRVPQSEWFQKYELTRDDHVELIDLCRELGVAWMSTPSHVSDLDLLEPFDPIAYKTGSDDLTNTRFLRQIAEKGRPMVVSTGMCTLAEIERAVDVITRTGNTELILLHCVVSYPAKAEDANLRAIETLQRAFGLPVGLSDHTIDEFTSVLATQMGACIIEKHFTLDHALKLPDHQASLDPAAFKLLVDRVRLVSAAMGDGTKRILPTEEKWRAAARKSLYAARDIAAGQIISDDDIAIRRPADGIHPHHLDLVIGRTARQAIACGALISWDMV